MDTFTEIATGFKIIDKYKSSNSGVHAEHDVIHLHKPEDITDKDLERLYELGFIESEFENSLQIFT